MLMKVFRAVALVEGITTLLLFLVAMPLKYGFGIEALIRPFGMLHGAAFVAYMALMVLAFSLHRVGALGWLRSTFAAFVPWGTFLNHDWLLRQGGDVSPKAPARPDRLLLLAMLSLGAALLVVVTGPGRDAAPQDPDAVVIAALAPAQAQRVALPWAAGQVAIFGPAGDLPPGAKLLFRAGDQALAVGAGEAAPAEGYEARFLMAVTGLALLQRGENTGAGWGPERLIAEARLAAGEGPAQAAALALLLELATN